MRAMKIKKETIRRRTFCKRTILILLALALLAGLAACSVEQEPAATPSPSPEITIITAEPVITTTDPYAIILDDESVVPAGYTKVDNGNAGVSLYAYTDAEGAVQYRVYGGYSELTNGVETQTFRGFYVSDETGSILDPEAGFVDTAGEAFGSCTPAALPETLRLRSEYHALDAVGTVADDSGNTFVYGSIGTQEGAFYPADASGVMIPGALASTAHIADPSYLPQTKPETDGERMLVVYIGTQTVVCYKAENGEWTVERVMICSTGRTKKLTPRGEFHLVRQYLYKKMGQIAGENVYSQYASRITGSYLFHSVPIGGEDRFKQENGKKQMFVEYYEKLGTPASGGCVRLRCVDAYWIYMNCVVGTPITVTDDSGPNPPEIPKLIYEEPYMDARHEYGWDPSDPDPENPYHAIYTPEFVLTGPVVDKSEGDTTTDTGN